SGPAERPDLRRAAPAGARGGVSSLSWRGARDRRRGERDRLLACGHPLVRPVREGGSRRGCSRRAVARPVERHSPDHWCRRRGRPIMARRPPDDEPEWAGAVTRAIHPWSSRRAMPDDELSPEEEAELERLAHDVVDEAERVGVDWGAAQERMRALAEAEWTAAG